MDLSILELYKGKCLTLILFNVLSFVFKYRFKKETGAEWQNNKYGPFLKKHYKNFNQLDRDDQEQIINGAMSCWYPEILVDLMINYQFTKIDQELLQKENEIIRQFKGLLEKHVYLFNIGNDGYKDIRVEIIKKIQLLVSYCDGYYSIEKINTIFDTPQREMYQESNEPKWQYGNKKARDIIKMGETEFKKKEYKKAIRIYEEIPEMYDKDQNQMSFYLYGLGLLNSSKSWLLLYFDEPEFPEYLEYARQDIERAIKCTPMSAELWFVFGCIDSLSNPKLIGYLLIARHLDTNSSIPQIDKLLSLSNVDRSIRIKQIPIIKSYFNNSKSSSSSSSSNQNKIAKNGTWGFELVTEKWNGYIRDFSLEKIAIKKDSEQAKRLFKTIQYLNLFLDLFNDGDGIKNNKSPEEIIKILYQAFQLEFYAVLIPKSLVPKVISFLLKYIKDCSNKKKDSDCCYLESKLLILAIAYNCGDLLLDYYQLIQDSIKQYPNVMEFKFYRSMYNLFKFTNGNENCKESFKDLEECVIKSPNNLKYLYYYLNCLYHISVNVPTVKEKIANFFSLYNKASSIVLKFTQLSPEDGWKVADCYFFLAKLFDSNKILSRALYEKGMEIEKMQLDCIKEYSMDRNQWKKIYENNNGI